MSRRCGDRYAAPNSSIPPIRNPPSMAPRTFPIPPMTAATNALSPKTPPVACADERLEPQEHPRRMRRLVQPGIFHGVEEAGRGRERRPEHERERDDGVHV